MKISACYIVKNEAAVLTRSLTSIQGQVDEIIVVDTGSVDNTKEIAKKYGAKIFDFAWIDDFAAARNFALHKASGDFILFLDADEYFLAETASNLRQAIETHSKAEAICIDLVNIDEKTKEVLGDFFALRVFRNRADIFYKGRIHEQVCRQDGKQLELAFILPENLLIFHTGYSREISSAKAERNLKLLLSEYEISQEKEKLYMYLAEAYDGLDNCSEAKKWAELDINSGRKPVSFASRSYRILLRYLAKEGRNPEQRWNLTERAVNDFPEVPEFWAEYAEALAGMLSFEDAIVAGKTALAKFKEPRRLEPWQFDDENARLLKERLAQWQAVVREMKKIKISACLIARNDARDISRWADNVKAFADEIVYVDTGADDESPQIMAEKGIRAVPFTWGNDFAAARNFAIGQATGDWIVFTDADEYFLQSEKVRPFLAEVALAEKYDAVMMTIINVDEDDNHREIQRFQTIRIFRRDKDICYQGKIHETLVKKTGKLCLFTEKTQLGIIHLGYSTKRIRKKLERNLSLLEAEIANAGKKPGHHRYLAECYLGLERYEEALQEALTALTTDGAETVGSDSDMYFAALRAMTELNKPQTEKLQLLEAATTAFPNLPDFWAEWGLLLAESNVIEAHIYLERAAQLAEQGVNTGVASRFANLGDRVYFRLAEQAARDGLREKAKNFLEIALRYNRYYEAALNLWFTVCVNGRNIIELYQERADLEFLLHYLQKRAMWGMSEEIAIKLKTEYGVVDELAEFNGLRQKEDYPQLYKRVVSELTKDVQKLFAVLVKMVINEKGNKLVQQNAKILPVSLQHILEALTVDGVILSAEEYAIFTTFLPAVAELLTDDELIKAAALFTGSGDDFVLRAGKILTEQERWAAAMSLFQLLPADSAAITGDFWYQVGKCLFYLQQKDGAQEAFERALKNEVSVEEISSYLAWLKEGNADG